MQFSNEFISRWEHIINDVDITDVPLTCIKKLVIRLEDKKQRTVNLSVLRKQGLTDDEIEAVINRILTEFDTSNQVLAISFVIDVALIANLVQPETDKLLSNLK